MSVVRVAVTGLGAVTALGPDVPSLEKGLRAGTCGVRECTLFDTEGFRTKLAAQAPEPTPPLDEALLTNASRPDRFGLQAAFEAVRMAGLDARALERAVLIFGTGTGGAGITEQYYRRVYAQENPLPPAAMLVPHQPASVTDLVARHLNMRGPRTTIMTACSSSATAIGYAADRIRLGHVDVAIAGGAEGLCRLTYAGFNCLRATTTEYCRPFDVDRKGLNLGEGAAVLVLESETRARARGATILGFLAGYGITADAYHMTAPHPEGDGAARAMQAALDDAGLTAAQIGYINAHGTATPHNDAAESAAIKTVLGARAPSVPISSIKSMVGHTLGAAGAIEAVASILTLRGGFVPPTVNLRTPDPAFGLDFVPGTARNLTVDVVLSNSFAFGGNNTSLAFVRA
jgi:3-oxoacyl-[acyl-carrier-protein] synthase II